MKNTLILLMGVILVSSCSVSKKAHQYFAEHPKEFAQGCFDNFPCITKDSVVTKYITQDAGYDSVINELENQLYGSYKAQDSLHNMLQNDTACSQFARAVQNLQEENKLLQYKVQHIPPVIQTIQVTKTIADSAQLQAFHNSIDQLRHDSTSLNAKLSDKTDQYNEIKARVSGKVLIPWWWLLVIGAVIGGYIFLRIKNILSPIKI